MGASESISKYIRVSYKTNMETMVQYLTSKSYWHLKKPELIISVTGGAKLNLKQRLKDTFCKSLVKAATTTSNIFLKSFNKAFFIFVLIIIYLTKRWLDYKRWFL